METWVFWLVRRVGDLGEAQAVAHKARSPAEGDGTPRPLDLAEEGGCYHALLLVRVEAAVLGRELLCHRFSNTQ
jgi:hypothetical protein